MKSQSKLQAAVETYYRGWNTLDVILLEKCLHPQFEFRGPVERHDSAAAFLNAVKAMSQHDVFKNAKVHPRHSVVDGETAVMIYDLELGTPKRVIPIAEYFRLEDGKVREIRCFYDTRKMD